MRTLKLSNKLIADIQKALNCDGNQIMAVKELMDKAYNLGYTRGHEAGIDYIFTSKPEEN